MPTDERTECGRLWVQKSGEPFFHMPMVCSAPAGPHELHRDVVGRTWPVAGRQVRAVDPCDLPE